MTAIVRGARTTPAPGISDARCPQCAAPVQPKCGQLVAWHFAHIATEECDSWSEPMTQWHLDWQSTAPIDRREVVMRNHRADLITPDGSVIELQHSSISPVEIQEREAFYRRMAWVFDARDAYHQGRLLFRRRLADNVYTFRWKHPRTSISACAAPVLLDLGEIVVLLKKIRFGGACGGYGILYPRAQVAAWFSGPLAATA